MEQIQQTQKIEGQVPMGPQTEKHKYVFPNFMAKMMKNVPMQVQFESSLMASALILVGLLLMAGFMMFFGEQTLVYKIILGINLIGGFLFMGSSMVTTYQQYVSYMDVIDFQNSMGMTQPGSKPIKKYNRKNQALFFGGLIIIIAGLFIPGMIVEKFTGMLPYEYYILGAIILVGVLLMIAAVKKPKQKVIAKQILKAPMAVSNNKLVMRSPTSPSIPTQKPAQQLVQRVMHQQPVQQRPIQQPVQRPVATQPIARAQVMRPQQIQRPVQQPAPISRPIQKLIQQQTMQPRPVQRPIQTVPQQVQRQQIPAQRPIPAARPVQQPQQPRPVFRPQPQIQQTPVQAPTMIEQNIEQPKKLGFFARMKEKMSKKKQPINNTSNIRPKQVNKKEQEMLAKIEQSLNKQLYDVNYMKNKERRY